MIVNGAVQANIPIYNAVPDNNLIIVLIIIRTDAPGRRRTLSRGDFCNMDVINFGKTKACDMDCKDFED